MAWIGVIDWSLIEFLTLNDFGNLYINSKSFIKLQVPCQTSIETHQREVIMPLVCSLSGAPLATLSDSMNVSVVMNVAATPNLFIR